MRLLVLLALLFGFESTSFAQDEDSLLAAYKGSDYTQCDAHFVSKTFGFSLDESKVYIGQKIAWGTTNILDGDLEKARKKGKEDRTWRCQFYQTGYTLDDAEALAKYWGVGVSEAKVRVEDKILFGNETFLKDTVLPEARGAHAGEGSEHGVGREGDVSAFLKSDKYDACHAKMLIGTWFGSNLKETKAQIGYKIRSGWTDQVEAELDTVRKTHQEADTKPCTFQETRWTYDDAQALATLWGQEVSEVKARIERKYAWGNESIIPEELQRAKK